MHSSIVLESEQLIRILIEIVKLQSGMRPRVCFIMSVINSGFSNNFEPQPAFRTSLFGQPQFKSIPLHCLKNKSNYFIL